MMWRYWPKTTLIPNDGLGCRREIYCIHLTKSHTLRFTPRAKERETEPDIFMAGERVDTPDTTVHLGIVRNTNGRADISMGKYLLGGKSLTL